jgi:membrane protein DedA with SNARE-associated domain
VANFIHHWGYLAVFLLTVAEAACIPIPSEVTVGYAGYQASTGRLDLALVIVLGTVGETVGAYIAYTVGRTGGRALIERFGRFVLLSSSDLDRAERWFERRGEWSVGVGRVVPILRTFIALPAGVAEMPLLPFGLLTAGGSLVWIGSLAGTGYLLGSKWNKLTHGFTTAGYVVVAVVVVAIGAFLVHRWRLVRRERMAVSADTTPPTSPTPTTGLRSTRRTGEGG